MSDFIDGMECEMSETMLGFDAALGQGKPDYYLYLFSGHYYFPCKGRKKNLRRRKKAARRFEKSLKRNASKWLRSENPLLQDIPSNNGWYCSVPVRLE